ncbi:MAG: insulinase family protein [Bdellovibrio sp.]|nr:MAG: insulinase family protein [Bdellovibrio sp.]
MSFQKTVLSNGLRILTESSPYGLSVSAGIFIHHGSRDDPIHLGGAAHLLEHMVFKGTRLRKSTEIVAQIERLGGDINAYTTQELICLYSLVLEKDLLRALDVLWDLSQNALLKSEDLSQEKKVILQEIDMSSDLLEEDIFDQYFQETFKGHPLGLPVLGTPESMRRISRTHLRKIYNSSFVTSQMCVVVVGAVNHNQVVEFFAKKTGRQLKKTKKRTRKKPKAFQKWIHKDSEQAHVLIAWPTLSLKNRNQMAAYLTHVYLGGGMTSRLYQQAREKHALAYSIYSYLHLLSDCGLFMVYAGVHESRIFKMVDVLRKEVERLLEKGISQRQLNLLKKQLKGQYLLSSEDVENRMNVIGQTELLGKPYKSLAQKMQEIEGLSQEDIQLYLEKYFHVTDWGALVMGSFQKEKTIKFF